MPIYDYRCACGAEFEQLVRHDTVIACPSCGGADVERRLSVPARPAGVSGGSGGSADASRSGPPPGSHCCGGGCHSH